jgi:hypothetical protein
MFAKAPKHTTSIIKMEHVAGGQKIDDWKNSFSAGGGEVDNYTVFIILYVDNLNRHFSWYANVLTIALIL